ncbi:MAG TPA: hypothetical protein VKU41_29545, partial [Polyangiaceae bacterium]|nr:hypothetical protein [Polyangiaceae bacterium]
RCDHRAPPPPPIVDAGGDLDLVFAVRSFEYGTTTVDSGVPLYQKIGFDLDDTCTGEGQGPSCVEPIWADASHHDGVDGIDNAFGQWGYGTYIDTFIPTDKTGYGLIRVRGYAGGADDDQVEVCTYAAAGVVPRGGGDDGGPQWDGLDRWTIYSDSLAAPDAGGTPDIDHPGFCDEHAYVTGGILVSRADYHLGPGFLILAPTYLAPAHHLVVAGRIAIGDAGLWELQDLDVGFRTSLEEAIVYFSQADMGNGQPRCSDPQAFLQVKQAICPQADITIDPSPPTTPCNAVSAAYRAQAKQALLGDVQDASSALAPCPPNLDWSCPP